MPSTSPPLSEILPLLVCGTATFNSQYNPDPYALPTTGIVHRAFELGVRAFDTSPYYGPAEELLGHALDTSFVKDKHTRQEFFLLSKVGRVSGANFDYSASWVRQSVRRSLQRLKTSYLDVVYCHDVEFVTAEEVLNAVTELRRMRDETGTVKYVGISGYPVTVLSELAEMVLSRTGEPLDAVMSYANFTLQNTRLRSLALPRLKNAGVDVVLNASFLGMGLLRREGVPIGSQGNWHPAPDGLRSAVKSASDYCDDQGERIEKVAIRYGLEAWLHEGKELGSSGDSISGVEWKREASKGYRLGVSVFGVSEIEELEETMVLWKSVLGAQNIITNDSGTATMELKDDAQGSIKQKDMKDLVSGIREKLGSWFDYAWPSPDAEYVARKMTALPNR